MTGSQIRMHLTMYNVAMDVAPVAGEKQHEQPGLTRYVRPKPSSVTLNWPCNKSEMRK